jgi:hypothetical protein
MESECVLSVVLGVPLLVFSQAAEEEEESVQRNVMVAAFQTDIVGTALEGKFAVGTVSHQENIGVWEPARHFAASLTLDSLD